jgi:PHP family Zn ribbon phosphoesterase
MTLPIMADFAVKKGINILTTGDFTHPLWFREISTQLEEAGKGVYKLKSQFSRLPTPGTGGQANPNNKNLRYHLTVEIYSIYSEGGKTRRIHSLIFALNLEVADKINK